MKKTLIIAFVFAALWMLIKYVAFVMGMFTFGSVQVYVLINMLCLTGAIAVSLYFAKKSETESGNLLQDIRKALAGGMFYTLMVSIFLYVFYAKIHPAYNNYQINQAKELLANPKNIDKIRSKNPDLENKSDKEIRTMSLRQSKQIANPSFTFVISLLALTLYSILNSMVIAIIYRKLLFKQVKTNS
jgi:cell division protein FtsL